VFSNRQQRQVTVAANRDSDRQQRAAAAIRHQRQSPVAVTEGERDLITSGSFMG